MAADPIVDVCIFPLTVAAAERSELWELLDREEQARARRFRVGAHAERFVVAHGRLRQALAAATRSEPAGLRFGSNDAGKPHLLDAGAVHFNLSHSRDMAAVAIAPFEVGVDIEADQVLQRPGVETFFAPREQASLQALDDEAWRAAVLRGWTRKEAVIKALGCGLGRSLSSFCVTLLPGQPAALLQMEGDPHAAAAWQIRDLHPAPGFRGAVAARHTGWKLRLLSASDIQAAGPAGRRGA